MKEETKELGCWAGPAETKELGCWAGLVELKKPGCTGTTEMKELGCWVGPVEEEGQWNRSGTERPSSQSGPAKCEGV